MVMQKDVHLPARLQAGVTSLLAGGSKEETLAALTDVMGGLHEHQVKQLKLYGLACSAAVVQASFEPDHETKVIKYLLVIEKDKIEKDIGQRLALLKKAVAVILQGWSCQVRFRQTGTVTNDQD